MIVFGCHGLNSRGVGVQTVSTVHRHPCLLLKQQGQGTGSRNKG